MRCSHLKTLACALIALVAVPALADTEAPPADLFAEPACAVAPSAVDALPGTVPEPELMTGCTAELTCPASYIISCTGNNTCNVGSNYVECDGNRTYCPTCDIPYPACYAYPAEYCACVNGGGAPTACRRCICLDLC